jgi:DNA-3-methyladenine glycosylase I
MKRCAWAEGSELERRYHDAQWGVPVHDDRLLFEMLTLESAQAGLSWSTILAKREGYIKAFDNFDIQTVAGYSETKIESLLQNPAIIRNKLKIHATINNAKIILEIQKEYGSFDSYIWSFVGGKPIKNHWERASEVPANTPLSDAMSKAMKQRGFHFVGTTICYAYMQAVGMVNDHLSSCFRYDNC